jgi:hypothetical protein
MLILGVVLLLIGLLFGIQILWIIGLILAILGAVLLVSGGMYNRPVGGRRYWY